MTIQSEINRIKTNVDNMWDILEEKGATIPQNKNTDNMGTTLSNLKPDYTAIGNELRKAKCYTYENRGAGKLILANPNKYSDIIDFNTFRGVQGWFGYFILDGKRYSCNYADNSDPFTMTQQGTYNDCIDFQSYFRKVDNNLYYKNELIDVYSNFMCSYWYTDSQNPHSFSFITNGKLYSFDSWSNPSATLIDDTGNWTYLLNYYGLRDGKLCSLENGYTEILDFEISPNLFNTEYYAVGNSLYRIYDKYAVVTFSQNIDTVYGGRTNWVKLADGKIHYMYNENIYIDKDIKKVVFSGSNGNVDYVEFYILTTDGHIYRVDINNDNITYTEVFTDVIGTVNDILIDIDTRLPIMAQYLPLLTSEDTVVRDHLYVAKEASDVCYSKVNNNSSNKAITSKTNASITVNNKEYTRNSAGDSTFTFVPNELKNYTFSEQEVCQAYLNAGVKS